MEGDRPTIRRVVEVGIWRAPMASAAAVLTAGVVADRLLEIPMALSLLAALAGVAAWAICLYGRSEVQPLVFLALAGFGVGAAWHHDWIHVFPDDDLGRFATIEARPVKLRGVLVDEPTISRRRRDESLRSMKRSDATLALVAVDAIRHDDEWTPVSGRVRVVVDEPLEGPHLGDLVEVVGLLSLPDSPDNPGGFDYAGHFRDRRIRAEVHVRKTADGVRLLDERWRWSFQGWLAFIRGWGERTLERCIPDNAGVASALLLGNAASMSGEEWDPFLRTGVIHVLAISGQHLVVVAGFLWILLRLLHVRRRHGAWVIAVATLGYALLTGGRPPILRAAFMVCFGCGLMIARRTTLPANVFALAWILVVVLDPADVFQMGCQLSFLAVAMLYWAAGWTVPTDVDPLQRLVDSTQPRWWLWCRRMGRSLLVTYGVTALVWIATTPLVAARQHLVSPVSLVIGPPVVVLTSIALVAGFLMLAVSLVSSFLAMPLAFVVDRALSACDVLVQFGARIPGSYVYVPDVPTWWLVGFYLGLFLALTLHGVRRRRDWTVVACAGWLCVGLIAAAWPAPRELRLTFLAVGHGSAVVIETPDGRTLLYDAGSLAGPDVTRRHLAPFLWHRGIRSIDDVFLSHADLDHFNGIPDLLDRFTVGQITTTPTFANRATPGVQGTLDALERRGILPRIVRAGDRLTCGDVAFEVLHPSEEGPPGKENFRSLVLRIRHRDRVVLLTGDLEGPGLREVLRFETPRIDVMMSPHHGSKTANPVELAAWARPKVVVSCQGRPRGKSPAEPYSELGAHFLPTWSEGAVTVRATSRGLVVETFRTGQRFVLK